MSGARQTQVRLELTSRLVAHDSMRNALKELGPKFLRYTVAIRRSMLSPEVIETKAVNITIFDEPLVKNDEIDERLLRSKSVILVGSVPDGGTAVINLTTRKIQPIFASPELKLVIDKLNAELTQGARSRWVTGGAIAALVLLPLAALVGLVIGDQAVNPRVRAALNHQGGSVHIPFDHWVGQAALPIAIVWIFTIVTAIILGAIRAWSGPLGIWPEKMTANSIAMTVYRLRGSSVTRQNLTTIAVSVIAGALIVLFGRLL
jgi:hypothetical protein